MVLILIKWADVGLEWTVFTGEVLIQKWFIIVIVRAVRVEMVTKNISNLNWISEKDVFIYYVGLFFFAVST